jgi:hypothetical protein
MSSGHAVQRINENSKFSGDLVALYGWGGHRQQSLIEKIECNYVAFDLGYWERGGFFNRKWRVSINNWHCPDLIFNGPYKGNKEKTPAISKDSVNPDGHILLIGSSTKSARVGASGWSKQMAKQIRKKFPESKIVYRPKPKRIVERVDCDAISEGCDIQEAMIGARLVVCRHSNVSIDAAIAGIPCVAEDGAGAAIYPRTIDDFENQPDIKARRTLIRKLAWWQWSINELKTDPSLFTNWLELQLSNIK